MPEIQLTRGYVAIVDECDFENLSQYKWYPRITRNGRIVYARSRDLITKMPIDMHRLIMGFPPCEIDHKNRNGLDNRRCNLRLASRVQNLINTTKKPGCKMSKFIGVWKRKPEHKTCQARIRINGKKVSLGTFKSEEDAARCYKQKAIELYGEFVPADL